MFQDIPVDVPHVFAVKATGKLTDADYQKFLPRLKQLINENGQISLYLELEDFQGWEPEAAWDDLGFGLEHDQDFRRIAVVGQRSWEHWMIALSNLFMAAEMRFFPQEEKQAALDWVSESEGEDVDKVEDYRHILLATDFSRHARRAAARALDLSNRYAARLSLLHVVENLVYYDEFYDPIIPDQVEFVRQMMAESEGRLVQLAKELGVAEQASVKVIEGTPKNTIPSYAREQKVDLIVLGSHGRRGMGRLLGSVAGAVNHSAVCDVLAVRL